MSVRKLGLVVAAAFAALLIVPVAAGAQTTPAPVSVHSFKHIPVSGTATNGKTFTGQYHVTQFITRAGKTYALGTLTGKVGNQSITRTNVTVPVSTGSPTGLAKTAATCQILNLVLGPLHLNLLGLHVDLNRVVLNITGVTGPGNLLGNLLCGVAGLLDQGGLSPQQVTGLLNIVQQLLNVPGLLSL